MKLKFILSFALSFLPFLFWSGEHWQKSPSLALAQTPASSLSQKVEADVIPEIQASLVVGSDIPVPIPEFANRTLQGEGSNAKFVAATAPDNLPVSAEGALKMANSSTLSMLTQPPIKTTVEYLLYTSPRENIQQKPVWRVIYWGSGIPLSPPPLLQGNRVVQSPMVRPTDHRAITYLLIDPFAPRGGFMEQGSVGIAH